MNSEGKKRQPRTPLTPDEVEELVYLKKIREHKTLEKFKKSPTYKTFNVINIICFFIYCELICCFIGPVSYQTRYNKQVSVEYGELRNGRKERVIEAITLFGVNNERYRFLIGDYTEIPERYAPFEIGSDFLLGKDIKGKLSEDGKVFKLAKASPILFLSILVGIFSFIVFYFDLNQNLHSLTAITVINMLTVTTFVMM